MENKHPKVYIHTKIGKIAVYHHFANSDKTPIIFLHGVYFDHHLWDAVIESIKDQTIITLDMPMHGMSKELLKDDWTLNDCADMLIEIYMAESTLLRTEKLAIKKGEAKVEEQIAMAKLYLYKAVDVVTQKGKESIISFAEGDEQRMMLMGLRRFTKYTNMPNIVGLRETITTKLVAENSYCF